MAQHMYISTVKKTSVTVKSFTSNFTSINDINIIHCKTDHFDILKTKPDGSLFCFQSVPVFGNIIYAEKYRPISTGKDCLLLIYSDLRYISLSFCISSQMLITNFSGSIDVKSPITKNRSKNIIGKVDHKSNFFAFCYFEGLLIFINLFPNSHNECNADGQAFIVITEPENIVSLDFVPGTKKCCKMVILYSWKDNYDLKSYIFDAKSKTLIPDNNAIAKYRFLVGFDTKSISINDLPVNLNRTSLNVFYLGKPLDCLLVLTLGEITIYDKSLQVLCSACIDDIPFNSFCKINAGVGNFILGTLQGDLYTLVVKQPLKDENIILQYIGKCSSVISLSNVEKNLFFVGSSNSDSQLISILSKENLKNRCKVIQSFPNIGPIKDITVSKNKKGEIKEIFLTGGYNNQGKYYSLTNGVTFVKNAKSKGEITESGEKDLEKKKYKKVKTTDFSKNDPFIESTLSKTNPGEKSIEEYTIVNKKKVSLYKNSKVFWEWSLQENEEIVHTSFCDSYVIIATSEKNLYLFDTSQKNSYVSSLVLPRCVSCVGMFKINGQKIAVVTFWNKQKIYFYSLIPSLKRLKTKLKFDKPSCGRCLLVTHFLGNCFLICGLGNGKVICWRHVDKLDFALHNEVFVGATTVMLKEKLINDEIMVFAISDKAAVIHYDKEQDQLIINNLYGKLREFMSEKILSNRQCKDVHYVISTCKLRLRNFVPEKIKQCVETKTTCIAGYFEKEIELKVEKLCGLALFDKKQLVDKLKFEDKEKAITDFLYKKPFFIISTCVSDYVEMHKCKSFVRLVQVVEKKLFVMFKTEVEGAIFSMDCNDDKLFLAINNYVMMMKFVTNKVTNDVFIENVSKHHLDFACLEVKVFGNLVLVGDLIQSIILLRFNANILQELSSDYCNMSVLRVAFVDSDFFVVSDNNGYLYIFHNALASTSSSDPICNESNPLFELKCVSKHNIGSVVKVIETVRTEEETKFIIGDSAGGIKIAFPLTTKDYNSLKQLQTAIQILELEKNVKCLKKFKTLSSTDSMGEINNFISGDIVETFLTLNEAEVAKVVLKSKLSYLKIKSLLLQMQRKKELIK